MRSLAEILEQRRHGTPLTQNDIEMILSPDSSADCVVSAMLMAFAMGDCTDDEVFALTQAYVSSGRTVEWSDPSLVCDKHSTGCVGDDVSIVLAPLLAALGLKMAKISGGALRHCGGTIDKLSCIPGIELALSVSQFSECVERRGFCLASQSAELVPADARTYAMRELIGTVEVPALIAASVMSKKLACGAQTIALEVKFGSGGLLATEHEAQQAGRLMRRIGESAGRRMIVAVSEASLPLAPAAGPLLELKEAVAVLRGQGSHRLRAHVTHLSQRIMHTAGLAHTPTQSRIGDALDSGVAFDLFLGYVEHLGGDVDWIAGDGLERTQASTVATFVAPRTATFAGVDARAVGETAQYLVAAEGPYSGVRLLVEYGAQCLAGAPLLEVHSRDSASAQALAEKLGQLCQFQS
jgi:pyrimidine-nucleoside phosphorylase